MTNSNKIRRLLFKELHIRKNPEYKPDNYYYGPPGSTYSPTPSSQILKNKNFENKDLSYLNEDDFEDVTIENCNFHNTGLNINFKEMLNSSRTLYNVKFSKEMTIAPFIYIDIKTLELNPDYPFTDQQVTIAILNDITKKYDENRKPCAINKKYRNNSDYVDYYWGSKEGLDNVIKECLDELITRLRKYNRNTFADFLEKYQQQSEIQDVYAFLNGHKQGIDFYFQNLNFTPEEFKILSEWDLWQYNKDRKIYFENCTFDTTYENALNLTHKQNYYYMGRHIFTSATFSNCSFSNQSYANNGIKRIGITPFSCNTSAYIKVGNKCNATCSFCKNQNEQSTKTDIDKIVETLCDSDVMPHLNQLYFGGGEPSLYLKEIEKILKAYYDKLALENPEHRPNWYIFTNGGGNWKQLYDFFYKHNSYEHPGKIILSRHAIDDIENKRIIGLDYSLEQPHLKKLLNYHKIALALTCSEENMKDDFLEEYYNFGKDLGVRDFIIQNLEARTTQSAYPIEEQFQSFEQFLLTKGFEKKDIVSSSYFDLSLYKNNYCSVALKRHFDQSQLEEKFQSSPRHSHDLAVDSNGDLYSDYQLTKKIILPSQTKKM